MLQALAPLAPYLLPASIGALTGGVEAARRGKNPLEIGGAALIGGGLGAGLGLGGRMAGQALAGMLPTTPGLVTGAQGLGLRTLELASKAAPTAVVGLGSLAIPGVAAGLAGAPGSALKGGAEAAAAGANVLRNRPSGELDQGDNVPEVGQFGRYGGWGTPFDVLNPLGQIQGGLALERQEADVQLENIKKFAPYLQKVSETAKKAEFERNMAAAGIRQNIATQAAMLQRNQQTAQQMGLGFAGQVGQALTGQYQYS